MNRPDFVILEKLIRIGVIEEMTSPQKRLFVEGIRDWFKTSQEIDPRDKKFLEKRAELMRIAKQIGLDVRRWEKVLDPQNPMRDQQLAHFARWLELGGAPRVGKK